MRQTALITGGSRGIGRAVVEAFLQQGMEVYTCGRSAEALDRLREELGDSLHTLAADVSQRQGVTAVAEWFRGQGKPLHVLVNNAGLFLPGAMLSEPEGQLEHLVATNVYSAFWLTRELVDVLPTQQGAYIFNMASIASLVGYEAGGSYAIAKHALLGFTRALRQEVKDRGIRVSAVMPGATYTSSWEGVDVPAERFMDPADVAEAVVSAYRMSPRTVVEEIILRPQLGDL